MLAALLLICNGSQLSIENLNAATPNFFQKKSWQWSGQCQFPIYKSHSRATALFPMYSNLKFRRYWIANLHEYICTVLDFYRTKEALLQILNCSLKPILLFVKWHELKFPFWKNHNNPKIVKLFIGGSEAGWQLSSEISFCLQIWNESNG